MVGIFKDMDWWGEISSPKYHGDNIKTPPVAKILFQNIWEIFENMKTQKKTFENIFLEISKPWIDAREAREKILGFLRRFTRKHR